MACQSKTTFSLLLPFIFKNIVVAIFGIVLEFCEWVQKMKKDGARFGSTYTKIGTIQRRLAWPLRKDDTLIREAFRIFSLQLKKKKNITRKKNNKEKKRCNDISLEHFG